VVLGHGALTTTWLSCRPAGFVTLTSKAQPGRGWNVDEPAFVMKLVWIDWAEAAPARAAAARRHAEMRMAMCERVRMRERVAPR